MHTAGDQPSNRLESHEFGNLSIINKEGNSDMFHRKKILVIATGGTIACKQSENGLMPAITSDELLDFVPEVRQICDTAFCLLPMIALMV